MADGAGSRLQWWNGDVHCSWTMWPLLQLAVHQGLGEDGLLNGVQSVDEQQADPCPSSAG